MARPQSVGTASLAAVERGWLSRPQLLGYPLGLPGGPALSASPRRLGGAGFQGNRIELAARAEADKLQAEGRWVQGWRTEPGRREAGGDGGGCLTPNRVRESSVRGLICSCSDFHCGTCARNTVSYGRKRRFPPRGTGKDLINASESRAFWRGARPALRDRRERGLSRLPSRVTVAPPPHPA